MSELQKMQQLVIYFLNFVCVFGSRIQLMGSTIRMEPENASYHSTTMHMQGAEPEDWKSTSGLAWNAELDDWKKFTQEGRFPKVLDSWLNHLEGPKKQVLRDAWVQAEKEGILKKISPWMTSSQTVMLEEGQSLLVAYRVEEKDIKFQIKQVVHVPATDDSDLPSLTDKSHFRETCYSRAGTSSIVYWKPTVGFEAPDEVDLQENPNAKPYMQLEIVWDNSYSWLTSKTVMVMIGTLTPAPQGGSVQNKLAIAPAKEASKKWTKTKATPAPVTETLTRSTSLTLSSSLKDALMQSEEPAHPLDKKQCDTAKDRVAGKQGFFAEIALVGYLKEIGQAPTKETIQAVNDDIAANCDIPSSQLAVSSDAEFLTKDQCDEAKERAGGKKGPLLELVLKHYIKEIGKKPSAKMMSRATEQITAGCEEEGKKLTTPQCLGIKQATEQIHGGPEKQVKEVQRGLEAFGQVATAKLVTETLKLVSDGCPSNGMSLHGGGNEQGRGVERVPTKQPSRPEKNKSEPVQATTLDPDDCRQAQEAIKGKPTMFVGIHLKKWLQENGKDSSPKMVDAILAQLQGGCSVEAPQVDVEDTKVEQKEEKEASVSSGTIRRKDFVDDPRFAKYRMMKKIRQPEGAVLGRMNMDKGDLLKAGLTELELDCFLQLLFDKVEECNVAPPKGGKVLTAEFLNDDRLKKYKTMKKIGQGRGQVEGRMTMDKADLTKQGLTDAELDCVLQLLFDEVTECDASPAGKILGPEFVETDNPLFEKYRKMKKFRQPAGAIEGRILMDMQDLEKLGFTKTDMECFLKLLFEEVKQCICGPAERAEKQSKEARGLAVAKDVHEKLTSLLDGDNGLMPGVQPSLDWATEIFQATIPKQDKRKPQKQDKANKTEQENLLDGKTQQNLGIILKQFPKDMVFEGYLTEIGRAEWSFKRSPDAEPLMRDLETMQRAVMTVSDSVCEAVKPNLDKITDKHDQPHQFVKALINVKYSQAEPKLNEVMTCMLQQKKYADAIKDKADTLGALQKYYEKAGNLGGTLNAAANGFVVQLLDARILAGKDDSEASKEAFDQYDTVLRKFRQASGGGDEADVAIVPLLALNNVIIEKQNRLRVGLTRTHPDLAKTLSPTYLSLFKKYLNKVIEAEQKQALQATEEPLLTYAECEEAKEAKAKAKNPMFQEMALNNFLKGIGKADLKAEVAKMLKEPCQKPAVAGPLNDQECQDAQEILKNTPNPMFQGIKLANFFKEIGKGDQKKECQAQVEAGCPSANPPEPLYTMSAIISQCQEVAAEKEEPSIRNSVRGAISGVLETQKAVKECVSIMPALKQESFEALMEEGDVVIDIAKQVQETVFDTMIQSAAPFLPHSKDGTVDKKALQNLYDALPSAGGNDDDLRIRGANGVAPKYSMSDFLDDEALRYSFRRICTILTEGIKQKKSRSGRSRRK